MDEKLREKIALFRYIVIGSIASSELAHAELKRRIRELSTGSYGPRFGDVPKGHVPTGQGRYSARRTQTDVRRCS